MMWVDLSPGAMVVICEAQREFRTVVRGHVKANKGRLTTWIELRQMYDAERMSAERKVSEGLAAIV
ncbi:hypothetical protein [Duganella vulcania]|uniref:Uncharacterized protein n=1 Tax=Duganella vulcania TaxID=2692166 RepID=A0A845GDV9_9BURK|nr:hypothetical protein [Duganella vulcania]MYM92464.1 hypothetical protein [Duganella vulcania]